MTEKIVLEPSEDHPISIEPVGGHVRVQLGDRTIAETDAAVSLNEARYAAVLYVPLEDVDPAELVATDHYSYCPYKGDASYYSLPALGDRGENAVWEYRDPLPAVAEIKGKVAFYADRVEISVR